MSDYETQYEEYKKDLLSKRWFISELHKMYRGSINAEKDYVAENGVLWKIGVLSGICGFCSAQFPIFDGEANIRSIIVKIILSIIVIACLGTAWYVSSKFQKRSAERIFYAFRYNQYIADKIKEEKDREARSLINDMINYNDALMWREENIPNMSEEDVKSLLLNHIKKAQTFDARSLSLYRYDRFISDIKYDYYFNAEIQKDIDKYI